MPARTATAEWKGGLMTGAGRVKVQSGAVDAPYDFRGRTADGQGGQGTNPEELVGAAHAGCFTMQLSALLEKAGFTATMLRTTARVYFEKSGEGFAIPRIELETEGSVPGIDAGAFQKQADTAKAICPVSKALTGTQVSLRARLV
ncbi:MAG: OsmC family peroxiredoxin [Phycisphaerales bacterium]|nr:OsmC family peroxiredoxin [Phycisphaerales bacterium]